MVYITGDTHGSLDLGKLGSRDLDGLSKDDFVIVCGDFGVVWRGERHERKWLDWLDERPFTTLFVDGNHEGFKRLNSFPVEEWHGGCIHRIRGSVAHLMRGQAFCIEGSTFFALGGAHSMELDRLGRVPGVSWFPEEVPSAVERARALESLDACGWRVDYVLTHCAPTEAAKAVPWRSEDHPPDEYTDWLQENVADRLSFDRWFFGHYHADAEVLGRYRCLYAKLYEVGTGRLLLADARA